MQNYTLFFALQELLFFPSCQHCESPRRGGISFCFSCKKLLYTARISPPDEALFWYEGAVATLLRGLRGEFPLCAASHIQYFLEQEGVYARWRSEKFTALVTAPQSRFSPHSGLGLLGRNIARALGIEYLPVLRKAEGHKQHLRSRGERMDDEVFISVTPYAELSGKKVLLIDDVFTTGTTLAMSAYVLRKAGAAEVVTYTLAMKMMNGFEGERHETKDEGDEVNPFLAHLFV